MCYNQKKADLTVNDVEPIGPERLEPSWNCNVISLGHGTGFPVRKTRQITFNEFTVLLQLTVVRSGVILYT